VKDLTSALVILDLFISGMDGLEPDKQIGQTAPKRSPPHSNADDVWFFMQRHFATLAQAAALEMHHIEPPLRRQLAFLFCLAR
jgi:CheY-like chemotaxis protein